MIIMLYPSVARGCRYRLFLKKKQREAQAESAKKTSIVYLTSVSLASGVKLLPPRPASASSRLRLKRKSNLEY